MTLYIVFDMLKSGKLQDDSRLIVTKRATKQIPSKLYLKQGETILVRDAIKALVTKSANDVATTIADNLAGSEAKFARYMTWKARTDSTSSSAVVPKPMTMAVRISACGNGSL